MDNNPRNPAGHGAAASSPATRVLRLKEVCKITGLGRSYIYQLQADGQFPRSIKLGVRAVGWLEKDVQHWIDSRVQLSRVEGAKN